MLFLSSRVKRWLKDVSVICPDVFVFVILACQEVCLQIPLFNFKVKCLMFFCDSWGLNTWMTSIWVWSSSIWSYLGCWSIREPILRGGAGEMGNVYWGMPETHTGASDVRCARSEYETGHCFGISACDSKFLQIEMLENYVKSWNAVSCLNPHISCPQCIFRAMLQNEDYELWTCMNCTTYLGRGRFAFCQKGVDMQNMFECVLSKTPQTYSSPLEKMILAIFLDPNTPPYFFRGYTIHRSNIAGWKIKPLTDSCFLCFLFNLEYTFRVTFFIFRAPSRGLTFTFYAILR